MCEIDLDVLELIENILAKNAVDFSVHCVGDALHILYENAMVFPNSRSGDQCRFSQRPSPTNPVPFLGGSACRRLIGSSPDASGLRIVVLEPVSKMRAASLPLTRTLTKITPNTASRSIGRTLRQCGVFADVQGADCRPATELPASPCPRQTPDALRASPKPSSAHAEKFSAIVFCQPIGRLQSNALRSGEDD